MGLEYGSLVPLTYIWRSTLSSMLVVLSQAGWVRTEHLYLTESLAINSFYGTRCCAIFSKTVRVISMLKLSLYKSSVG